MKATERPDSFAGPGFNDEGQSHVKTKGILQAWITGGCGKGGSQHDFWVCVRAVGSVIYPTACSAAGKVIERHLTDELPSLDENLASHRGLVRQRRAGLTCPQVLQVYHEARS